jgi:hypothetical protein
MNFHTAWQTGIQGPHALTIRSGNLVPRLRASAPPPSEADSSKVPAVTSAARGVWWKVVNMGTCYACWLTAGTRKNAATALQKRFSSRKSCYGCNISEERSQRASADATSVLTSGLRSSSEIPASASAFTPTSSVEAVASSRGCVGATSCSA